MLYSAAVGEPEIKASRSIARVLLACAILALTALLAAPAVAMIAVCETLDGRAGAVALAAGRRAVAMIAGPALALALLTLVIVREPAGTGDPASGLTSHWLEPYGFVALSPANLIPELDQIKLEDSAFKPFIQRFFGDSYTGCVSYQVPVQREIHALPEWRALGNSGMHEGWSEVWSKVTQDRGRTPRHWYRYLPPHQPGERLPVVVFFHGFGSNAKHDLWCWKALAERARFAILEPSMGFGLIPEGGLQLDRLLAEWRQDPDLDWSRAYVAGLSNGAVRAARCPTYYPGTFRGVILLSPVQRAVAEAGNRAGPLPYPPVLAIHGALDWAVTPAYMKERKAQLAARGVDLTLCTYLDMDHYVNFRARERWHADIERWMHAH